MRTFVLTEDQTQIVAMCLQIAAEQFHKDAVASADNPRLAQAFIRQAEQAEAMAVQIEEEPAQ